MIARQFENEYYQIISRRAYELYEQRLRIDGFALDHWLKAENEIQIELQFIARDILIQAGFEGGNSISINNKLLSLRFKACKWIIPQGKWDLIQIAIQTLSDQGLIITFEHRPEYRGVYDCRPYRFYCSNDVEKFHRHYYIHLRFVSEQAYALYENRGKVDGFALDDWSQAKSGQCAKIWRFCDRSWLCRYPPPFSATVYY